MRKLLLIALLLTGCTTAKLPNSVVTNKAETHGRTITIYRLHRGYVIPVHLTYPTEYHLLLKQADGTPRSVKVTKSQYDKIQIGDKL